MPRLFISHSSRDNLEALAFKRWLTNAVWGDDELFIDRHGIAAGEEWQKVLVKANIACDALLFLASPDSLSSEECRREVRRDEDDRKDVLVAMLKGVTIPTSGCGHTPAARSSTSPRGWPPRVPPRFRVARKRLAVAQAAAVGDA